jgi:cytochrome P450
VCLGKTLAELEGVYVLVGLLQRFRFTLAEPQVPVRYNVSTTLQMKEPGLRVKVDTRGREGLGRA